MTCNIRGNINEKDTRNNWANRKDFCLDVIVSRNPHIISFQELTGPQFRDIRPRLSAFDFFGLIDDPQGFSPVNCIFYRKEAFRIITAGGFWLSETPHIPGSKSWDCQYIRLANWIRLEEAGSKKEFRIMNAHLEHNQQKARENQARLLNENTAAYGDGYAQILTGDMNCDIQNPAVQSLIDNGWHDTYAAVHNIKEPGRTMHWFFGPECKGKQPDLDWWSNDLGKIDWIFTRGNCKAVQAEIIQDARDGLFPSDHYFVSADIDIQ
jgi:endonuclease/exonuclease/phosphatase family metal-dependent hydrolase